MRRTIWLMTVALVMSGCAARKALPTSTDQQTRDSVVIREVLRDTVITVAADSSLIRALVECDSTGRARLRELKEYQAGARLPPPRLSIDNNVLTATAEIDSMTIYLILKDRYRDSMQRERKVSVQAVEVNRLTWWQTLWMRLGQILSAAGILAMSYKIYKTTKQ